ncbi:hypothetical protein Tco_0751667 [Tanacetum coccineum]|uniref:Reverse transcriptase domain-containing protein n=1 Tax=Tanacetum coccineum TaxID=301880 RepID=A0ABQ4Z7B9_9ASTR
MPTSNLNTAAGDHRKLQLNELSELRDQAYENSLIYKEKTKKLHDSKIKNRIFNVGDQVLLFNSRLKIFSGKLKSRWSGPFTITEVYPYGTAKLSHADGSNFKVNCHRLKHYYGGDTPPLDSPNNYFEASRVRLIYPVHLKLLILFWGRESIDLIPILSQRGYFEELMRSCRTKHLPSPVEVPYIPEPEYPKYLVPSNDEAPIEDQPLPVDASPVALSPSYVADSDLEEDPKEDPEEDSEEDHSDYPADGGDDDDEFSDNDDMDDEDEEPFKDEEEEEHLARPTLLLHLLLTLFLQLRIQRHLRLMRLHLHMCHNLDDTRLGSSLFIPPVDHREDTFEAELPPYKRLCLTALTSRYKVGESSMAAPRPTGGHGADYGFIGTIDAEVRRQRAEEVGYGIRDVWEQDIQDIYAVIEDTQGRDNCQQHWDRFRHFRLETRLMQLIARAMNNMPPKRTSAAARAAAATAAVAPMTAAAIVQLIDARVSAALANHETLRNSTNGHGDGSHNSGTIYEKGTRALHTLR